MSISAFDHPFLSGLLGDDEIARFFSADEDIRAMLAFEAALAKADADHGFIPAEAAPAIAGVCVTFKPDLARLKKATATDGVVVPDLIKQLRQATGGHAAHVHVGGTSQDVIDSSLMIRLKAVDEIFVSRLKAVADALAALDRKFGATALMGYTRMQAAIPIRVADRLRAWREPLLDLHGKLRAMTYPLQFGGAAGTLDTFGDKAAAVRASLAQELGLEDVPHWQSQRGIIAELAGHYSLISGSLGKIGQDITLMAQVGGEIELAGGGSSSAMAHKQNPVAAEALVALARFNATQLSAIHHALIHEQERSGAAWTLEWLILPQMAMASAAALRLAQELAGNIRRLGKEK